MTASRRSSVRFSLVGKIDRCVEQNVIFYINIRVWNQHLNDGVDHRLVLWIFPQISNPVGVAVGFVRVPVRAKRITA